MKKYKVLEILLLCMKILLPILILIPLIFLSCKLIEVRMEDLVNVGNDSYYAGSAFYIFASHMLLFVVYAILTLVGGVFWIIARTYKSSPRHRKNVIAFRWLTLTPVCAHALYLLINLIVMNLG